MGRQIATGLLQLRIVALLFCLAFLSSCVTVNSPEEPIALKRREIDSPIPILMVHGLAGRAEHFDTMRDRLARAGWDASLLYIIDLSDHRSGRVGINEIHAEEIRDKVSQILDASGHSHVNIIAHSMGVLSSMYYIKALGGEERVRCYVGLDGRIQPNRGALRWLMPDTKKGTRVMAVLNEPDISPGGALPDTKFPKAHEPGNIRYKIFFQKDQGNIFDGAEISIYPDVGHVEFLTDEDVFREILDFLVE